MVCRSRRNLDEGLMSMPFSFSKLIMRASAIHITEGFSGWSVIVWWK
jgi:hypothetical protein